MQPDTWDRVQRLFLIAADMRRDEIPGFLDSACGSDQQLRGEVESLLAGDRVEFEPILTAVEREAAYLLDGEMLIGEMLGDYRVIHEIGRGGMGTVYLAIRDDDQYHKNVAIKVVRRGMDSADVLVRFRHERQILANLEHPYIARLFDGGTTFDGRPYFVMEYVEGLPLDDYVRTNNLDLKERCQLFLQICEAVSYAHANLVVHRDLKPGNIFVTAGGTPKLLDFGVAKLLTADPDQTAAATVIGRAYTPDYASPEQVRAQPVTTAADVYSLGAILYELLTNQRAHRFPTRSPADIERVICDVDPPRVGDVAPAIPRRIRGDLEAIVSMAMRKEPQLRYASVEQLAADLRRCWTGEPVVARHGSRSYRLRKFLLRNRTPLSAAAAFTITVTTVAAVAVVQANHARVERARAEVERTVAIESQARAESSRKEAEAQAREASYQRVYAEAQRREADSQRSAAEAQQQIAERRFGQVRQLSGKFLLDFHDAIAKLPGSTAARKMVVQTGLEYYDTLIKEAHGNRGLLEEIARGYDRLGDVQGNPYYANLGDSDGAMKSYEKARAIREKITDDSPDFLRDRIQGNVSMAQLLGLKGDLRGSEELLRATISMGSQPVAAKPYAVREVLAGAYRAYGDIYFRSGNYDKSIEPYSKVLDLATELSRENRNPLAEQALVSLAHTKLGDALVRLHRTKDALGHLRTALDIDTKLAAADRNSAPRLRKVYIDYSLLALVFKTSPELTSPGEARKINEEAADIADRMAAADPNNSTAVFDVMVAQTLIGDWLRDHDDPASAVPHYRKAVEAVEKFASTTPPSLVTYDSLIYAHQRLGSGLGKAGRLPDAVEHLAKAEEYVARAEKQHPGLIQLASRRADIIATRAEAYARQKRWTEAITAYSDAIRLFDDLRKRDPKNASYADEHTTLLAEVAESYASAGQWGPAISSMEAALDGFRGVAGHRPLTAAENAIIQSAPAKLAIWKQR